MTRRWASVATMPRLVDQRDLEEGEIVVAAADHRPIDRHIEPHRADGRGQRGAFHLDTTAVPDGDHLAGLVRRLERRREAMRCATRLPADRHPVDEQLDLVVRGVDVDPHRVALAAGPRPTRHGIGPGPRTAEGDRLAVVLGPVHCDERRLPQPEHDLAVVRLGPPVPGDVDVAAAGRQPRERPGDVASHQCRATVLGVLHPSDTGLAEVVPARPGEVADHVGVGGHQRPVDVDVGRVGLGPDDHPVRVEHVIGLVPDIEVVVAGDVRGGERFSRLLGDDRVSEQSIAQRLPRRHLAVDIGAGDVVVTPRPGLLGEPGEDPAHGEQRLHPGCHVSVGVEGADLLREVSSAGGPQPAADLGDLVAHRVHDDARVVDVLAHHRLEVSLPPLGEVEGVVVIASWARSTCRTPRR